jgi:hypothetical protein
MPKHPVGRDPYFIAKDGHIIGNDGFIVPISFEEFVGRYPTYLRSRVRVWAPYRSDTEDLESELAIFLMSLPADSKFRMESSSRFPCGCKDRIQTFDPDRAYGASAPRFFNYTKLILKRRLIYLWYKASRSPERWKSELACAPMDQVEFGLVDDCLRQLSNQPNTFEKVYEDAIENQILVAEFLAFVRIHNPELLEWVAAIQKTDTYVEAGHALGITGKTFNRGRSRLAYLYQCFETGTGPQRQRKERMSPPR